MLYKDKNSNWVVSKYAAVALLVGFTSLMVASCERVRSPPSINSTIRLRLRWIMVPRSR